MRHIGVGWVSHAQSLQKKVKFSKKFDPVLSRVGETQSQLAELKATYAEAYGCKIPLNMLEILQFIQQQRPQFKKTKRNMLNVLSPLTMFLLPVVGSYVEFPIIFRKRISENALYDLVKDRTLGPNQKEGNSGAFYNAFQKLKQVLQEKGLIQVHWNGFEYVPRQGLFDDSDTWFPVDAIALTPKAEALLEYA